MDTCGPFLGDGAELLIWVKWLLRGASLGCVISDVLKHLNPAQFMHA